MAAPNPAPGKGYVRQRPTPLVGDVLFYELRDRDVAANQTPPAYGTAHPDTRQWPDHKLVLVEPADTSGWEKWWYAADRDSQDNYNYRFEKDGDRDLIVRTNIAPRSTILWAAPATGEAFDPTPADVFAGVSTHYLVRREMRPIDDERISSLYAAEILVYEKLPGNTYFAERQEDEYNTLRIYRQRVLSSSPGTPPAVPGGYELISERLEPTGNPLVSEWIITCRVLPGELLTGFEYDSDSDRTLPYTTQVVAASSVPAGTAASSGIDADGFVTEYQPIDQFQTKKIRRMVVADGETLTYDVSDFVYSFPRVFQTLEFSAMPRKDGRFQIRVNLQIQDGGSRFCRATIVEEWFKAYPGTPPDPVTFVEDGFVFQGANLQFTFPACLHPGILVYDNVGTGDPIYEPQTYSLYVPATNYSSLPASFVARVSQSKYKGGWKRETVTVHTPADLLL